jgi:hypothetical protein
MKFCRYVPVFREACFLIFKEEEMEAASSSETKLRCYIPEDRNFNIQRHENVYPLIFKSEMYKIHDSERGTKTNTTQSKG